VATEEGVATDATLVRCLHGHEKKLSAIEFEMLWISINQKSKSGARWQS
jgi:hypothetical protein